jgi:hypothetical protein
MLSSSDNATDDTFATDAPFAADESFEQASTGQVVGDEPRVETDLSAKTVESSSPFVGQWNQLVSTTNWEKGRIIADWREAVRKTGAHVTEFSDEAWTRLVGNVTSQHVGRLRRAHERFGAVRSQYSGLFWSHFQAALDWDDAEMWLEGAISNRWSVSQMRGARWEANGGGPEGPTDGQVIEAQIDEDSYNALTGNAEEASSEAARSGDMDDEPVAAASRESAATVDADESDAPFDTDGESGDKAPRVRPFADLAKLPDDVADAFEQFKLVILSHKMTGWDLISRDDLLGALDALKALAVAPSADDN